MEVIPNTPPDGQVGVILGTVGVAFVAAAQLLNRDAVVVRFSVCYSWSVQVLLDQRASLDTSALVQGKVAVRVQKLFGKTVASRRKLASRRRPLGILLLC